MLVSTLYFAGFVSLLSLLAVILSYFGKHKCQLLRSFSELLWSLPLARRVDDTEDLIGSSVKE